MKRICGLWLLLIAAWFAVACGKPKPAAGPVHEYRIDGMILKTNSADQTATIKHKAIEGWMGAMTMDYPIRTKEDFSKLHPGDRITGTVYVQDEDYSVGNIHAAPGVKPGESKPTP